MRIQIAHCFLPAFVSQISFGLPCRTVSALTPMYPRSSSLRSVWRPKFLSVYQSTGLSPAGDAADGSIPFKVKDNRHLAANAVCWHANVLPIETAGRRVQGRPMLDPE